MSFLIAEKNRNNYEFEDEYEKNLSNIYSFTDKIVKFDTNITMLKSKIIIIIKKNLTSFRIYSKHLH